MDFRDLCEKLIKEYKVLVDKTLFSEDTYLVLQLHEEVHRTFIRLVYDFCSSGVSEYVDIYYKYLKLYNKYYSDYTDYITHFNSL